MTERIQTHTTLNKCVHRITMNEQPTFQTNNQTNSAWLVLVVIAIISLRPELGLLYC
jgi:hypothetical protein